MILNRIKARLLHIANTRGYSCFNGFYELKEQLLRRYAAKTGFKIQHIVHECWGCDKDYPDKNCYKCMGTGIYAEYWIRLKCFKWYNYEFMIPQRQYTRQPVLYYQTQEDIIEGKVTHNNYSMLKCHEASYWLLLLCGEFHRLWHRMKTIKPYRSGWWPLLNLGVIVFKLHRLYDKRKRKRELDDIPF